VGSSDAAFLTPTLFGFLLVLFRCAALCSVAPLFGMRAVPRRVRMGVSVAITFAVYSGANFPIFAPQGQSLAGALIVAAITETAIGLVAGICSKFAVEAAQAAGQLISVSMGLSYGSVIDPIHGAESTAISELLGMFSLAAIVAAGTHREAVVWLCRSVITVPPGSTVEISSLAAAVVTQSMVAVALAVRMAFPVMVAVTFGHIGLGVLSRSAPQLSISSLGFALTIIAGGGALYMVAPSMVEIAARSAATAFTGGQ